MSLSSTYGCAPKTRGALVLFTDGAWLDDQKVLRAAERLTRLAPSAGLFVIGLRPNEAREFSRPLLFFESASDQAIAFSKSALMEAMSLGSTSVSIISPFL